MVSEETDQIVPGLAMIHRLCDLRDLNQTLRGQMSTGVDDFHAPRELLEVALLRGPQRILTEERDYGSRQIRPTTDEVLAKVLSMVVMPPVDKDAADPEEASQLLEARAAALALRHDKPVEHLVAGCVASSPRTVRLPYEADREASFSVYKADHPATELDQSFLLIVRTRHVVTIVNALSDDTMSSAGYTGFSSIQPDAHRAVASTGGSELP